MKYLWIIFISISLLGIGIFSYAFFPHKERTHVMLEVYATAPAFLQMTEFVKLPPEDKKIIGWHRFPKRGDIFPLMKVNATEISLKTAEGHYYYQENLSRIIADEIKQNPNRDFIIHSNMNSTKLFLIPLLQKLTPKERKQIEHLHLYEDGFCTLTAADRNFFTTHHYNEVDTRLLQEIIDTGTEDWANQFKVGLHKIIPSTYHLCHPEQMKKDPQFKGLTEWLSDADIVSSNALDIAKKMSPEEKQRFYKLIGFNEPYWRTLKTEKGGKNLIMFASGFSEFVDLQKQLTVLTDLRAGKLVPLPNKNKETVWLYKPHPSYNAKGGDELFSQTFPDMIHVPAQIPLEVFVIADLIPDMVVGYDSSFFFNLPPENIGFVLYKTHRYLKRLMELNILDKNKAIPMNRFLPLITGNDIFLVHPQWQDTAIINKNRLIRSNKDEATILKRDDNSITVKWDKWGQETFEQRKDGIYYYSKEKK